MSVYFALSQLLCPISNNSQLYNYLFKSYIINVLNVLRLSRHVANKLVLYFAYVCWRSWHLTHIYPVDIDTHTSVFFLHISAVYRYVCLYCLVLWQSDFEQYFTVCRPVRCPNSADCSNCANFTPTSDKGNCWLFFNYYFSHRRSNFSINSLDLIYSFDLFIWFIHLIYSFGLLIWFIHLISLHNLLNYFLPI